MAKLYFRYGAMECGKTTHLLQVAYNYEKSGVKVLVLKPSIDTKGDEYVISRLGTKRKVDYLVNKENDMNDFLEEHLDINCILVDEAQFLTPKQVDELYEITKALDIPIICYGLRCDFQMNGFPGATRLLEIADDIEEMKTICACGCGKKATQNMRLQDGVPIFIGKQILIDDETAKENNTKYIPVSGECYLKTRKKILYKK